MKTLIKIRIPSFLIALILALTSITGLFPKAQAVSPPPDGCYPGFTTAEGCNALQNLGGGAGNTALGWRSLFSNVTGNYNTAIGAGTLIFNTADSNTAVGTVALLLNTTGMGNTAVGTDTLVHNADGSENTAVGTGAGPNLVAGLNNTYIGDFVGTLAADESSTIRIGDLSNGNGAGSLQCYIGGIFNNFQPVGGSVVEVTLDLANDHLGWDVGPSQKAPTIPSRAAPGRRGTSQSPARPQGDVLRAIQRQAMLGDKGGKLEATVAQQQKQIETLTAQLKEQAKTFTAQLKEQASQIQKVSAQLEVSKSAPQTVLNNQ
jgi:hypothetical protein